MTVVPGVTGQATRPRPVPTSRRRRLAPIGWVGITIVGTLVALTIAAPALAPYRSTEAAGPGLAAPSADHLLGTNLVGQDVASQMLRGAHVTVLVALIGGAGAVLFGALIGTIAGWVGGLVEAALMRAVDLVLATPQVPLLVVLGAYAGPSVAAVAAVIALTSWPPMARVVRAQVLSLRHRGHLDAAVTFGARVPHILRHHVLPEVGLILAAGFVAAASRAVSLEAGLAFLGLGDPTQASWGRIMRDALSFHLLFDTKAWSWWLLPPVAAVALLLLGLTFVGMALEERVNPRLARHLTKGHSR
jgi:peptide/nickel transport system permease protein